MSFSSATYRSFWIAISNNLLTIKINEWDPIGVYSRESLNGWPEWPDDEYTSYIGGLINLIELNATEEDFFDYLWEVETKHIGMGFTNTLILFTKSLYSTTPSLAGNFFPFFITFSITEGVKPLSCILSIACPLYFVPLIIFALCLGDL
jgi:hypothetical protein